LISVVWRAIVRLAELRDHLPLVLTQADEVAISVQSRALQKAAELLGGRKKLAERLGVKVAEIEIWIAGGQATPREVFLRVVDLLIDEIPPSGGSSEPGDPPFSRSSAPFSHRDRD
jgi:Putative antitoxin of bacterial toxin-antitoxin system, YdaS/YdaT